MVQEHSGSVGTRRVPRDWKRGRIPHHTERIGSFRLRTVIVAMALAAPRGRRFNSCPATSSGVGSSLIPRLKAFRLDLYPRTCPSRRPVRSRARSRKARGRRWGMTTPDALATSAGSAESPPTFDGGLTAGDVQCIAMVIKAEQLCAATRAAYVSSWRNWEAWCYARGVLRHRPTPGPGRPVGHDRRPGRGPGMSWPAPDHGHRVPPPGPSTHGRRARPGRGEHRHRKLPSARPLRAPTGIRGRAAPQRARRARTRRRHLRPARPARLHPPIEVGPGRPRPTRRRSGPAGSPALAEGRDDSVDPAPLGRVLAGSAEPADIRHTSTSRAGRRSSSSRPRPVVAGASGVLGVGATPPGSAGPWSSRKGG